MRVCVCLSVWLAGCVCVCVSPEKQRRPDLHGDYAFARMCVKCVGFVYTEPRLEPAASHFLESKR